MELHEVKQMIMGDLESWASEEPDGKVVLKNGKKYTRRTWVDAIRDDTEDGNEFLQGVLDETLAEQTG